MADLTPAIVEQVARAFAHSTPLCIRGGNSKSLLLGRHCEGEVLNVSDHTGIIDLQASELVMTARAGTPISELMAALQPLGLTLGFESPEMAGKATLGGTLAGNLSGPARPWAGSIRDAVLGVEIITGKAERLRFGGKVMKNVAGYDVSRLQAGALGTLGVLTEVTLRVTPLPELVQTIAYEMDAQPALATMCQRAGEPGPLSGAFWVDGTLYLRLSGAAAAVTATAARWSGEKVADAEQLWRALREFELPFFAGELPLWRASVRANADMPPPGEQLIDWGGAQRWYRSEISHHEMEALVVAGGGHASLFRGGDRCGEVKHTPSVVEQELVKRLKASFDPAGILNPGRLYSWL